MGSSIVLTPTKRPVAGYDRAVFDHLDLHCQYERLYSDLSLISCVLIEWIWVQFIYNLLHAFRRYIEKPLFKG